MKGAIAARLADGWQSRVDPDWLEGWEACAIALDGGATDVLVQGSGPAVLLLPGVPGYKEMWLGVARRLARRHRVVAWDLRPGARGDWSLPLRDLERVADAFAPGRAAVIGHSLGGALAQRWALARPDRVSALVLSSTFARVAGMRGQFRKRVVEQLAVLLTQRVLPEPLAARCARGFAASGAWVYDARCDERTLAFVRHAIRTVSPWTARDAVRMALAHDARATLQDIAVPTRVVVGERETSWIQSAARELAGTIPRADLQIAPDVGHLHPLSTPDWLATQAADWIARHGAHE